MDHDFADQVARQLHGIHGKFRSAEAPQPVMRSRLIWELQVVNLRVSMVNVWLKGRS